VDDGPARPERGPLGAGVLRTPEARFEGLAGYPFEPRYAPVRAHGVEERWMHYVDAGDARAPVVLLLHGQPTWSYLYRTVVPVLVARGLRALAPDHIGFGRSDKPADRTEYTLRRHIQWTTSLVEYLDLHDATLVVQDWGGPIGLGALAAAPDRFARVVATNTALHTCDPGLEGRLTWANHGAGPGRMVIEEALLDYVQYCQHTPDLVPSLFLSAGAGALAPEVARAYDAPFPDARYGAGLRQMTALIPLSPHSAGARANRSTMEALAQWRRPFLTAFTDGDPATRGWETVLQHHVPGAAGLDHRVLAGAGHFVPEERGEELAGIVADLVRATS